MTMQDERPRFYEGQFLAAADMNAIVDYQRDQMGRHELGLHGWGIAIGLDLVEQPTPGAPSRVNVMLTPGLAIDGFARKLAVLAPSLLNEAQFATIPYDPDVDDPARTGGTPPGRFVQVWLAADEKTGVAPPPGFAQCDAGDAFARVIAGWRILLGPQPPIHRVELAGQSMDATLALRGNFNASAPLLADESVPQQAFPDNDPTARWLVPLGWVRWVVQSGGGGYFVDRNVDPADPGDVRNRRARRYVAAIAESLLAPAGALVLRDRLAPPLAGGFQDRLQSGAIGDTLRDLVWVEGRLRVVGDVRLAGGALRLADRLGGDQQTPLSLERYGDKPLVTGKRVLGALIGPAAQADNRFAVATVVKDDPDPAARTFSEKLSVLSGGNVGIGNPAPAQRLHVNGDRLRLDNGDGTRVVDLCTDGGQTRLETQTSDLCLRAAGGAPLHNLLLNPAATDGNVGIGTASPAYKLDVRATGIKLGLEANGGGQLILGGDNNRIVVSGLNAAGTAGAAELRFGGKGDGNLGLASFVADTVTVKGGAIRLENAAGTKNLVLFNGGSEVDLLTDTNHLSLRSTNGRHCLVNWLAGDGNVGIGTGSPQAKLHVGGAFMRVDGQGDEGGYIGGDGNGNDVQIGSFNPFVTRVSCWNAATNGLMSLSCSTLFQASDALLKTNVRPLTDALDLVGRLRGVRFEWRQREGHAHPGGIGFIAHEVAEVLPELVGEARSYATVSYVSLVPVLTEAVKELKRRNEELREELHRLAASVGLLTAEIGKARPAKASSSRRRPRRTPEVG